SHPYLHSFPTRRSSDLLALPDPKESGIVASLQPASYTVILAGKNQTTGIGLVEVYDTNPGTNSQLGNISTRGFVLTGSNVMIGRSEEHTSELQSRGHLV